MGSEQYSLFSALPSSPHGFSYQSEFLSLAEETELLTLFQCLPFKKAQYRQWTANRRVVSFGGRYDFSRHELLPAPEIPQFLLPLRQRIAAWSGLAAESFNHAMIAEYSPGTQLGWHRDVPEFEVIVAVSLAGQARLRLRPHSSNTNQSAALALDIAPRSVYALQATARWQWQHAISPTKELRYAIIFRTRRRPAQP